jgi:ribosome-associated translation inhibitor RaiA
MAKVTIEFNTIEEQHELELCINASKWYSIVWDYSQYLRNRLKHEALSDDAYKAIEEVLEKLHELLNDEGLKLD